MQELWKDSSMKGCTAAHRLMGILKMKDKCRDFVFIVFHVDEPVLWRGWALFPSPFSFTFLFSFLFDSPCFHLPDQQKSRKPCWFRFKLVSRQQPLLMKNTREPFEDSWAKTVSSSLGPYCESFKGFQWVLGDTRVTTIFSPRCPDLFYITFKNDRFRKKIISPNQSINTSWLEERWEQCERSNT